MLFQLSVCCFQIPRRLIIKDVIGCFSWLFIMITSFASSTEVWTFSAHDGIIIRLLLSVIADLSSLESWSRAFQYPNENGNVNFATKMGMLPPQPISRQLLVFLVHMLYSLIKLLIGRLLHLGYHMSLKYHSPDGRGSWVHSSLFINVWHWQEV